MYAGLTTYIETIYTQCMVAKKLYSFYITEPQARGLKDLKERTGSSESELIRQALNEFLERKGAMKSERKRAATRVRS